jgi:hypothetical protein
MECTMTKPRAMTPEEMRAAMFEHMALMLRWWRDETPERLAPLIKPGQTEIQARLEGFLFSLLVMFDGGTGDIPGLNIVPAPHADDEAYCRSQGENWWTDRAINDTQMHEVFPWEKCR